MSISSEDNEMSISSEDNETSWGRVEGVDLDLIILDPGFNAWQLILQERLKFLRGTQELNSGYFSKTGAFCVRRILRSHFLNPDMFHL